MQTSLQFGASYAPLSRYTGEGHGDRQKVLDELIRQAQAQGRNAVVVERDNAPLILEDDFTRRAATRQGRLVYQPQARISVRGVARLGKRLAHHPSLKNARRFGAGLAESLRYTFAGHRPGDPSGQEASEYLIAQDRASQSVAMASATPSAAALDGMGMRLPSPVELNPGLRNMLFSLHTRDAVRNAARHAREGELLIHDDSTGTLRVG